MSSPSFIVDLRRLIYREALNIPFYHLLSSRFSTKARKSPPLVDGAFPGRSNRKTDHAGTVTNAFCLALCLPGPTFESFLHCFFARCPGSAVACSLGVGVVATLDRTFYTCPISKESVHKMPYSPLVAITERALKSAPSSGRLV